MKINNIPFQVTDWSKITPEEYKGKTGTSFWRTFEEGNVRVRMVEYSAGFYADHWCPRGHVLLVLDGEVVVKLQDGTEHRLIRGMSFQAGDDDRNPHLAYSETGAKVFIVD
jgi:quercetin dioxygenase-like cupin family protein